MPMLILILERDMGRVQTWGGVFHWFTSCEDAAIEWDYFDLFLYHHFFHSVAACCSSSTASPLWFVWIEREGGRVE